MADAKSETPEGDKTLENFVDWLISGSQKHHGAGGHEAHDFHHYIDELGHWGISRALILWAMIIAEFLVLSHQIPSFALFTLTWMAATMPVWLPLALMIAGWNVWILYIQALYISGRDPVVLEIKLPREIMKSPRAMEMALASMFNTGGESEFYNRAWKGQMRMWFSLEIASIGGMLHFYIWTWGGHRAMIEAALYAQFPDIEIYQVEDYASKFPFDPAQHQGYVMEYKLDKPDPYPIRTYIEFGLDADPKEEFKTDPLAQVLENLATIKPTEQVWVQIILRANGGSGILKRTKSDWEKKVLEAVQEIRKAAQQPPDPSDVSAFKFPNPTWRQQEQIKAIERTSSKPAFDIGVRCIYIADTKNGTFNGLMIGRLINLWRPFAGPQYLNHLGAARGLLIFEYPWQDFRDLRKRLIVRRSLDAYRRRSWFHSPWTTPHNTMTTESIASLWHFPSSAIKTPGLERIPATKGEAPSNLPT